MKIGLQVPSFTWEGGDAHIASTFKQIAQTADNAGFASIWVMDHFFQLDPMLGKAEEPMLEGYSALTYIAAVTEKVRLGTMVTGVNYRHPGFLIKQVTNLDVLSGGRAYLGIGAGWYDREAKGLGFPFPELKVRFEWLEETLQLAHHMWTNKKVEPFHGTHFQLEEPICSPAPLSQPHPSILIGGMGEKKTLRFVAQYADACNLFTMMGLDVVAHKIDVLKQHCDDLGRDFQEIEVTSLGTVHIADGEMSTSDVIDHCRQLADMGISHAIFNMPNVTNLDVLANAFGKEIIPAVAEF